ncbi:hypothetical protein DSM112329_04706 [Paraconexibacter sp. AEG42_29]|uniref:Long-chain-alcohol oxidase n=1 Tax=Paraconexibacter sp. AEG42_29 TaxID=2997339 RepID=A0AAU7B1R2_9ACTN
MTTFTPRQRAALRAICDTFTPGDGNGLPSASALGTDATLAELASGNPRRAETRQLAALLDLWDAPAFGVVLGLGRQRFSSASQADRERALVRLADSPAPAVRALFQALKGGATVAYYVTPQPDGGSPVWDAIGYPGPLGRLEDAAPPALSPLRITADTELTCDVVVVGSGAGGGTAAGVLSAAGLDVVVLEAGEYYDDADFDGGELDAMRRLYSSGPAVSADGQIGIVAGECLGGGTVVNYSTSFRTPDDVRAEWARLGTPAFATDEYGVSLDAVEERLGVNREHHLAASRDAVMERGLRELGWHVDAMPRNVRGCDMGVDCGRCGFGCRLGAKQSVTKTWLADAEAAGSRLIVGVRAQRITRHYGIAAGVEAESTSGHRLTVKARAVVVACGAIQTPALLKRSGFVNPNIGRHLRLHPVTVVQGVMDEEVRPWEGGMQTRYSREHSDLDGDGYGVMYETGPANPSLVLPFTTWRSAGQHLDHLRKLGHIVGVAAIVRDRDSGEVRVGRDGQPVVRYRLSERDAAHAQRGVEGAAQLLEAAGAQEVHSSHTRPVMYRPGVEGTHAQFAAATAREGYAPGRCAFGALHLMGSARMHGSPEGGAVRPDGTAWDMPNVVVADGSCFPTATGVNPMISIESIAHMNARALAARLQG